MLAILAILSLCGCGRKPVAPGRVVTQVDITCENETRVCHRCYTQPEKIRMVLNYLRLQEDQGLADVDPERLAEPGFRINVRMSDGSCGVYYQRGGHYLSKKYQPWKKIDPKMAAQFYRMLQMNPTDMEKLPHPMDTAA